MRENGQMTDFGGPREFTTWDGEPVSRERPHGVTVVVASCAPDGWRFLLLHRAHHGGPAREGDWAWTPPSGSRRPGDDLSACVTRELSEEIGLRASPRPVAVEDIDWAVFAMEVPWARRSSWTGKNTTDSNGLVSPRRSGGVSPRNWRRPLRPPVRRWDCAEALRARSQIDGQDSTARGAGWILLS
jgi:8-oxo-dGTP pyrophosphatase MutT (NUDIX family)